MVREKRNMEDVFNEFKMISSSVMSLSGIVQNKGMSVSSDELLNFYLEMNRQINRLYSLRDDVIRFYQGIK